MRARTLVIFVAAMLVACGSSKKTTGKSGGMLDYGSPNVKQTLLDNNTFKIDEISDDPTYGYTQENPIMVGGGVFGGAQNERRFLNALMGPEGEAITYVRQGSCCEFKTKNGFDGGGLLDKYIVAHKGLEKEVILYINMYDSDTLKIPVGFKKKK